MKVERAKKKALMKKEKLRNAKTFDELLDLKYSKVGKKVRNEFGEKANDFVILELEKFGRKSL